MTSASCLHMTHVQCLYYMLCLKQMVCNVCTICRAWNEWCAMLVLYVMLEMNGVQCLYNMLCLKWMVCNACTICYAWNEWCAMLVICATFDMNGVQCLYYVLPTLWYWGRYLHTFYSCPLSSCKIDYMLGLRAHFYNTIARKLLSRPNSSFPFSSSHCPPHHYPSFTRSFLVTIHLLADTNLENFGGQGVCWSAWQA